MRSHSSLALFPIDSSHRARPHCALSLATASASSSATSHIDDTEAMDVDVDPPVALVTSSEVLPTWRVVRGVPFPSDSEKSPRKHALLRSSAPLATSILTNRKDRDSPESVSPTTENQPPRKRTRTSALLQPPIKSQRSPRSQSLPMRSSPSRLARSASSLLFSGHTKPPVLPKPAEEPFTYAFPTSSLPTVTILPQSPLLDLISCLITSRSLHCPSAQLSVPSPRRRKPFSGGTPLLRNVYKSVIRGLALKYSVTALSQSAQVHQGSSGTMATSPFDIQDALLADRLRCHLTLQGEDTSMIVVAIETMESQQTAADPSPNPIMPYERLLSFILLQKNSEGRSRSYRKRSERLVNRKPSKLAESCNID